MSRSHHRTAAMLAAIALVVGASAGAGASAASRLVFSRTSGAAQCPDERRFRAAVAERLGYDPFFPWAEQTVSVEVLDDKGALRGKIALIDSNGIVRGARELVGKVGDCEELLASLALATSITLDPMAASQVSPDPTLPDPAPTPPPVVATSASPVPKGASTPNAEPPAARDEGPSAATSKASPATKWSVYAGPMLSFGETPAPSVGGRLGGAFRYGAFSLHTELRGDLPTSAVSDAGSTAHAGVFGGAIAPCFVEGPWAACGIVYLGSMETRGSNVEVPLEHSLLFAAAGARAEVILPVFRTVEVGVHVDGMKSLILSRLYLKGREVWQTPPFWAALGFSAGVTFP